LDIWKGSDTIWPGCMEATRTRDEEVIQEGLGKTMAYDRVIPRRRNAIDVLFTRSRNA